MRNFVRKFQLAVRKSSTFVVGIKMDEIPAFKTPLGVPVTPLVHVSME